MNKNKIVTGVLLLAICAFAFFLRVYFCYGVVWSGGIVKYIDDRNVSYAFSGEFTFGRAFPRFMYFDAFTNFPHGSYSIAPMFDLILATFIWLISFGKPTIELINRIAPFYPVVLGSLVPIVIYL